MINSLNKGGNTAIIKKSNVSLIVRLVREMGAVSRTDLSKITGLSKGGLTPIIQELISKKVLRETGVADSDAGRKPIMLEIYPNAGYVVAIDFNRSSLQIALVDLANHLKSFYEYKYTGEESTEEIVRRIKSMTRFFLEENTGQRIVAIGVSAPGPLDYQEGIILNPPSFYGWSNIPIKEILEKEFGVMTFLDKDANAYAMAEKAVGSGKKYSSFIHITHSEGIGSGVVLNDMLYRGQRGFGTEIGHLILDYNGKPCDCGNIGCLEQYASMTAIIKWVESKLQGEVDEIDIPLKAIFERRGKIEWEDILEGLNNNSYICLEAMETAANYLGYGLINMINIFAPQAVIIGGRCVLADKYLLKPLKSVIEQRYFYKNYHLPDILISDIKEGALIGIACIAFEHILEGSLERLLEE
ncbi:MAG: ROK family protein [Caulobacteraceae bacterium]